MTRMSDIAHGKDGDCEEKMFNCDFLKIDREEHACTLVRRIENLADSISFLCPRVQFRDFEELQQAVQPKHMSCPFPTMLRENINTMNKKFKQEYERSPLKALSLALEEYKIKLQNLVEKSAEIEMEEYPEMQSDAFGIILEEEEEIEGEIDFLEKIIRERKKRKEKAKNFAKNQFEKKSSWRTSWQGRLSPFNGFSSSTSVRQIGAVSEKMKPKKFGGAFSVFPSHGGNKPFKTEVRTLELGMKVKDPEEPGKPIDPWDGEGTTTQEPFTTTTIFDRTQNPDPTPSSTTSTTKSTTKSTTTSTSASSTITTTTKSTTTTTTKPTTTTSTTTTTTTKTYKGDEPTGKCPPLENPYWWSCQRDGTVCYLNTCGGGKPKKAVCRRGSWKGNSSTTGCTIPDHQTTTTKATTTTTTSSQTSTTASTTTTSTTNTPWTGPPTTTTSTKTTTTKATTTTTTAVTYKGDEPNPKCPELQNPTWWTCSNNGNTCILFTCGKRKRQAHCRVKKGKFFWKGITNTDGCTIPGYATTTTAKSTTTTTTTTATTTTPWTGPPTTSSTTTTTSTTTSTITYKGDEPNPKCPTLPNATWWNCENNGNTCYLFTCGRRKRKAMCRVRKGNFFWAGSPSTNGCDKPGYVQESTDQSVASSTTAVTLPATTNSPQSPTSSAPTNPTSTTTTIASSYIGDAPYFKCPVLPNPTWWNCSNDGKTCIISSCGRRQRKAYCRYKKKQWVWTGSPGTNGCKQPSYVTSTTQSPTVPATTTSL